MIRKIKNGSKSGLARKLLWSCLYCLMKNEKSVVDGFYKSFCKLIVKVINASHAILS